MKTPDQKHKIRRKRRLFKRRLRMQALFDLISAFPGTGALIDVAVWYEKLKHVARGARA